MKNEPLPATPLDPAFLELLACPACDDRPSLHLSDTGHELLCDQCKRAYPISPEGIPMLLSEGDETAAQPQGKTG